MEKLVTASDVIVVGGGIAGLTTAYYLLEAGKSVCLVDENKVGQGASWAGGGILSPLKPWKYSQWHESLTSYSLECLEGLTEKLSAVKCFFERNQTGLFYAGDEVDDRMQQWLETHSNEAELLKGSRLQRQLSEWSLGKNWAASVSSGVWMPDVGNIRNPRFLQALKAYLLQHPDFWLKEDAKAQLIFGSPKETSSEAVLGIELRFKHPSFGKEFIPASEVVVTAGAWSTSLFDTGPQVKPIRGEMLLFRPKTRLPVMVMDGEHYLIPRADGLILAGSTTDDVGFDGGTTLEAKQLLQAFASKIIPEINELEPLRHWSGLRPVVVGTEGQPYIGAVKGVSGVWVNTGHFRNGIVHGAGAAKILVDTMVGNSPQLPLSPFELRASTRLDPVS